MFESGDKAVVKKLAQLKQGAAKARRPFDAEAWLNVAFFLGEQYVEWPTDLDNIRRIPRTPADPEHGVVGDEDTPRPVFNKIQSYIYTAHSETLQDKPSADVLPATDDWSGALDSDVNKAYLNWAMEPVNVDWDLQLSIATLWALITPSGWLKWTWDPLLSRPDVVPRSFFDLYVDPFAKQFKRARYAIDSMWMDFDQAQETFNVKLDQGDIGIQDEMRVDLLRGMGCATNARGVEVNELWQKPSKNRPMGVYGLWAGKKLIEVKDRLPYEHLIKNGGRLPFTQLGSLLRPDSMYYTTPVTALRPSQMVWNKFIAQAILIQDAFANPKWWIPEELQMVNFPNSSPRQILRGQAGNTGLRPELIQPPSMPDAGRLLEIFEQQMMHVVSVHEVSQGQVPGRVEAAKAIELLKSSDQGMYKHLLDTIDSSISEGWWQALMLARQFETPEKMVPTYSREGLPMVKRWKKGAADPGTRVRVVRMSGLGRTRAQRYDSLMAMWTQGIIRDPDVMAELLDVPIPSFTNTRAQDMRLARAENLELAASVAVTPNSWDNHAIHLREHNEYRKTMEFRTLPSIVKSKFEFHCQRHEELQLIEAQKTAKLLMAQQGIVAPPPGAPGVPGAAPPEGAGPGSGPATQAAPNDGTMYMNPQVGPGANPAHP